MRIRNSPMLINKDQILSSQGLNNLSFTKAKQLSFNPLLKRCLLLKDNNYYPNWIKNSKVIKINKIN